MHLNEMARRRSDRLAVVARLCTWRAQWLVVYLLTITRRFMLFIAFSVHDRLELSPRLCFVLSYLNDSYQGQDQQAHT